MRLKCDDGQVRNFEIPRIDEISDHYTNATCLECGYIFGVHDTKFLKPKFKEHVCVGDISAPAEGDGK